MNAGGLGPPHPLQNGPEPMEQRISLITLGVADVPRATAFYEALGWEASDEFETDQVSFFQAGGLIFAIWGREDLVADAHLKDTGATFGGMALSYNTRTLEEVDVVLDQAVAAGGRLLRAGGDTPWGGYTGYFADLDGHTWEVAWNPDFPIAKDGSISLS